MLLRQSNVNRLRIAEEPEPWDMGHGNMGSWSKEHYWREKPKMKLFYCGIKIYHSQINSPYVKVCGCILLLRVLLDL